MFRKVELWVVLLLVVMFFIATIGYGALVRHHYTGGKKFPALQKASVFIAEIPSYAWGSLKPTQAVDIVKTRGDINPLKPTRPAPQPNKQIFTQHSTLDRKELILVSRSDGDLKKPVVEIRDMNNFEILHSFMPDIDEIHARTDTEKEEFKNLKKNRSKQRYRMLHPAITDEGELIFHPNPGPLVKIDFCSEIIWINDKDNFHHSINFDAEGNIHAPSHRFPYDNKISHLLDDDFNTFMDDALTILNRDGEILFSKSVTDILIENGLKSRIFYQRGFHRDPVHLNDIQPVLEDGPHWQKNDLFLSMRHLNMVLLYRPRTNRIIKIIDTGLLKQHDVDIIDENTISIFNNNAFRNHKNNYVVQNNELLFYHFDRDEFSKKFLETFKNLVINTAEQGLADFLDDGSVLIEDQSNARLFYLDNQGEVVWEFNNLSSDHYLYVVSWARIIKEPETITNLQSLIQQREALCKN